MEQLKDKKMQLTGSRMLVARPHKADGVGHALRTAFRGGTSATPSDMQDLLDKIR